MADQKPLFKAPYDIKDVSALFAIVAFVLIIAAIVGNNLFGLFQQNVNFGWFFGSRLDFLWTDFVDYNWLIIDFYNDLTHHY